MNIIHNFDYVVHVTCSEDNDNLCIDSETLGTSESYL